MGSGRYLAHFLRRACLIIDPGEEAERLFALVEGNDPGEEEHRKGIYVYSMLGRKRVHSGFRP